MPPNSPSLDDEVSSAYRPTSAETPTPDVQAFLDFYETLDVPPFPELSPEAAREVQEQFSQLDPGIDVESEDRTIDGPGGEIPLRVYDPREDSAETVPPIVFFHGGGWVVGSLDTHDGVCRKLATETGWPVLSVEYRLAPEHPFPAGFRDCYRAVEWTCARADDLAVDPDRLVVAGDSAGGNLATAVALYARDEDGPSIAHQVLVYPVTGDPRETDSYAENSVGYFLTGEMMEWFADLYFSDDIHHGNVYARPRIHADLSGLPPATVLTAGFDPLRDDGAAYAHRLDEAGVDVTYRNFEGLIHGFFNMIADPVDLPGAHEAYAVIASDLESSLSE